MCPCKGVCQRYKAGGIEGGRYKNRQKRCVHCELFIMWEGVRCPCCSYLLRVNPRNKKYKLKLRKFQGLDR